MTTTIRCKQCGGTEVIEGLPSGDCPACGAARIDGANWGFDIITPADFEEIPRPPLFEALFRLSGMTADEFEMRAAYVFNSSYEPKS